MGSITDFLNTLTATNANAFLKTTYSSFVKQGAVQAWQMGFVISDASIARYLTSNGWVEMHTLTSYRFTQSGLQYAATL